MKYRFTIDFDVDGMAEQRMRDLLIEALSDALDHAAVSVSSYLIQLEKRTGTDLTPVYGPATRA